MEVEEKKTGPDLSPEATIERLAAWLERHYGPDKPEADRRHGPYAPEDVRTDQRGWLVTKKTCRCTCPPYDGAHLYPAGAEHRHWFLVKGVHSRTYGGPTKFWEAIYAVKAANPFKK